MRRIGLIAALGVSAMLLVSGCSANEPETSIGMSAVVTTQSASAETASSSGEVSTGGDEKVASLADALNSGVEFGEELTKLDGGGLERVYRMDSADVADAAGYTGSGATVDQISVWKATDDAAAQRIEDQLKKFLESQIESYADYKPDQVPKLEKAILEKNGLYVVLCVSEDAGAASEVIAASLAG